MNGKTILAVQNLSVVKGKRTILNVPALDVAEGEFITVLGPNGAGKSTLLKACSFLEPSAGGEMTFRGQRVRSARERLEARRRMAMVFQDPLLLRGTVLANVTVGLKLRGIGKETALNRAGHWLAKLRIEHLAGRDVRNISSGEAQRVSLARAMALEPDILFLDEPFTYLDMPTKAALVSELKDILRETGTTVFMVTHDLSDLPFLADRVLVLMEGEIKQAGPVEQVLSFPNSREMAEFLGIENIWPGYLQSDGNGWGRFTVEGGEPLAVAPATAERSAAFHNAPVLACIRPEHVLVDQPGRSGESAGNTGPNRLTGRIEAVYPYGYFYRLKIQAGFGVTALAAAASFPQPPKPGETISVLLPPEKIQVIKNPYQ